MNKNSNGNKKRRWCLLSLLALFLVLFGTTAFADGKVSVTNAQNSYEKTGNALSRMIKKYNPDQNAIMSSSDEYAAARLIVGADPNQVNLKGFEDEVEVIYGMHQMNYLQFSSPAAARKAAAKLKKTAGVQYVDPDGIISITEAASYSGSGDYEDAKASDAGEGRTASSMYGSWGTEAVRTEAFIKQNPQVKTRKVIAAVVDTGVTKVDSIKSRVLNGYDFLDMDTNPEDENQHGTHISGTIVDCTQGCQVYILPVRVFDKTGNGSLSVAALAVCYAVDRGAKVVNCSFGEKKPHGSLEAAINYAVNNDAVVCIAAGNFNENTKNYWPARMTTPGTIIVSAITKKKSGSDIIYYRAVWSNWGNNIDVGAPGEDIRSAYYKGGIKELDGTSMATPHVVAIAALYKAYNPSASPAAVEKWIKSNALKLKDAKKYVGAGMAQMPVKNTTKITLNKTKASLGASDTLALKATVTGTKGTIKWTSSDTSVATVASNGKVKAKKVGKAVITATCNGVSAKCAIYVYGKGAKAYGGHHYKVYYTTKSWNQALNVCNSASGHLVTITSAGEQNFVNKLVKGGKKNCYWIGLGYFGNWVWCTGEKLGYKNWAKNEPSSGRTGKNENVVMMYGKDYKGNRIGQWNDSYNRGGTNFYKLSNIGYICEWNY